MKPRSWIGPVTVLGILCAALALVYVRQVDTAIHTTDAGDFSNLQGCVSQGTNDVYGDIPPSHMKHESIARKETDEPELHSEFMERILEKTYDKDEHNDQFYVTFSVYYDFDEGIYKQIASAILCESAFESAVNKCRNRTYFFFSKIKPTVMADALLNDISRSEPIVRRCEFPRYSQ